MASFPHFCKTYRLHEQSDNFVLSRHIHDLELVSLRETHMSSTPRGNELVLQRKYWSHCRSDFLQHKLNRKLVNQGGIGMIPM